jgi:hypothetical protein
MHLEISVRNRADTAWRVHCKKPWPWRAATLASHPLALCAARWRVWPPGACALALGVPPPRRCCGARRLRTDRRCWAVGNERPRKKNGSALFQVGSRMSILPAIR